MERNNNRFCLIMVLAAMLLIPLAGTDGYAQDVNAGSNANGSVIFVPGYIVGNVSFGGEPVVNAEVRTSVSAYVPSVAVRTDASGNYKVTVGTPEGGSCNYTISCTASVSGRTLYFKTQTVSVSDGGTTTANFKLGRAYIMGNVSVGGEPVANATVTTSASSYISYGNATTDASGNYKAMVATPDEGNCSYTVSCYAYVNGQILYFKSLSVTVSWGENVTANFSTGLGYVKGSVSIGDLSIYSASVGSSSAGNELPGTSTSLSAGTEDYTLKVFTPDNGERTCNISCSVYTDNRKDLLVFKSQTVTIIFLYLKHFS